MSLEKINIFVKNALDRLIEQDKHKNTKTGLVKSFVSEQQKIEDAMYEVYTQFGIYTAIGAQLDVIGSLVGEVRRSTNDEIYRLAILARIQLNVGAGEPDTIINAIKQWMNPTVIDFREPIPAFFSMFIQSITDVKNIATIVQEIAPAGIDSLVTTLPSNLNPLILAEVKGEPDEFIVITNTVDNYALSNSDILSVEAISTKSFSNKALLAEVYLTKSLLSVSTGGQNYDYDIGNGDILDLILTNINEDYVVSIFGGRLSEVRI